MNFRRTPSSSSFFSVSLFFVPQNEILPRVTTRSSSFVPRSRFIYIMRYFSLASGECLPLGLVLNFRFEHYQRFGLRICSTSKHYYRSHDYHRLVCDCIQRLFQFQLLSTPRPRIFRAFSYVERRNKSFESRRVDPNAGALHKQLMR